VISATAQDNAAHNRNPLPISARREAQSIAHGPTSTPIPARPTIVATHRRGVMVSPNTTTDSGTTKMVVVLASTAVRPAGTQATARCANAKLEKPHADHGRQVLPHRHHHPPSRRQQHGGRYAGQHGSAFRKPQRRRPMPDGKLCQRPGAGEKHHGYQQHHAPA
jgi:hypothetical protein